MHVAAEYIILVVGTMAGAIALLFRLYVKAKDKLEDTQEARLREARDNRAMFAEFKRLLIEKKRPGGSDHGTERKERQDENGTPREGTGTAS